MDIDSKLEHLNLTAEEIKRFRKAFKDEKFRELLKEYADEISNPENKKKYEEEIKLLEQERGMDIKFVHPKPERVLKTSVDGKEKCFINVCTNDLIGKPEGKAGKEVSGRVGQYWSLPYSVTPGRPELDSNGNKYVIYDVVFHPETLCIARENERFMQLVDNTALHGVQDRFNVKIDEKNVKVLKIQYKGVPNPSVIRKPMPSHAFKSKQTDLNDPLSFPYPYDNALDKSQKVQNTRPTASKHQKPTFSQDQRDPDLPKEPTEPHYTIKYRSYIDLQDYRNSRDSAPSPRPKEIIITIDLPLLKSAGNADLTVTEKHIVLESRKPFYRLELELSYPVEENKGEAKFNKIKRQLSVTLPVLQVKTQHVVEVENKQLVNDVEHDSADCVCQAAKSEDVSTSQVSVSEPLNEHESNRLKSPDSLGLMQEQNDAFVENDESLVVAKEEFFRCTAPGESGHPTETSSSMELNCKPAIHEEKTNLTVGCEENSHDRGVADVSHQSFFVPNAKSKATAVALDDLGSGTKAEHSLLLSVPIPGSAFCMGGGSANSPSLNNDMAHCPDQVLDDVTQSQPNTAGVGPSSNSLVGLSPEANTREGKTEHWSKEEELPPVPNEQNNLPPLTLREINPQDGAVEIISDHTTSAAFSFQNSLLYELD